MCPAFRHGSRKIREEGKLVSFSLSEPDPRLFDLGAGYAEVKPSELLRREMKAAGRALIAERAAEEDQKYAADCEVPVTPLE